jgi:hypothetical protein
MTLYSPGTRGSVKDSVRSDPHGGVRALSVRELNDPGRGTGTAVVVKVGASMLDVSSRTQVAATIAREEVDSGSA